MPSLTVSVLGVKVALALTSQSAAIITSAFEPITHSAAPPPLTSRARANRTAFTGRGIAFTCFTLRGGLRGGVSGEQAAPGDPKAAARWGRTSARVSARE